MLRPLKANHGIGLQAAGGLHAEAAFQEALALQPDHFAALYSIAVVCLNLGEGGEGLAYAERCAASHPNAALSWYMRGSP
jgi:predicted Zn-dependent protease